MMSERGILSSLSSDRRIIKASGHPVSIVVPTASMTEQIVLLVIILYHADSKIKCHCPRLY